MSVSAIAVDFGSTNSGCARIYSFDEEGRLKYDTPHLVHSNGSYAKDNTWFYIRPDLLKRIRTSYNTITDDELRIESPMLHTPDPNLIWGRKAISHNADKLIKEGWVSFRNFKMMLYHGVDDATLDYPLVSIIKIFLRILKLECLHVESEQLGRQVAANEIDWGVTIPSIWTDANKHIMVDIAHEVFSPTARVLSEPEGPLVANLLLSGGNGRVQFMNGRTSLVIDMGGGTTDICLMKEVLQNDGSFKMEMIANTEGSAAGGNNIDEDFYYYLLRFISHGKTSDAGVAYDQLDEEALFDELFAGYQSQIIDFMDFEDSWTRLKEKRNLASGSVCEFTFTAKYRKWLIANGHNQVANVVFECLTDGCELPADEFRRLVLNPTFDKICNKIKEIIEQNRDKVNYDNIILAGGLSLNQALTSRIKETVREVLGASGEAAIKESPGLQAGAAIMTGACYMLVNKDFIKRLARRTYLYDSIVTNTIVKVIDDYHEHGIELSPNQVNDLYELEIAAGYENRAWELGDVILHPICIKGQLVNPYLSHLSSHDQTEVNIEFFSTDGKICIFSNKQNPDINFEGVIEEKCKPNCAYDLEVDFNEAQISNALHYILKEAETGEILSEGFINNVIAIE